MATTTSKDQGYGRPSYDRSSPGGEEEENPAETLAALLAQAGVSQNDQNDTENKQQGSGDQQALDDEATRDLLNRLAGELLYAVQEEEGEGDEHQRYHQLARQTDAESLYSSSQGTDDVRKPTPYELWRAAHEVDGEPKKTPTLTKGEWDSLVERLNETSRKRQAYLLRAQHKQIADELSGLTFTPKISKRSRLLAAQNKQLPERVSSLMRKKQMKLDKVRHERAQKELAEATFQPQLNSRGHETTTLAQRMNRRVGHLIQYDIDKRIRAAQRRQLQQELEDRELTFSPKLNKNSERIVEKINRDRQLKAREAAEALAAGDEEQAAKAAAASMGKITKRSVEREQAAVASAALAAVEQDVRVGRLKRIPLGRNGLTMLPGHENDTFRPKINRRSHALAERAGIDQKEVYERLYEDAKEVMREKQELDEEQLRQHYVTAMDVEGGLHLRSTRQPEESSEAPDDDSTSQGVPDKATHADEMNVVPFHPKYEFIVKRAIIEAGGNGYFNAGQNQ